jgi:WD40 repeat protein
MIPQRRFLTLLEQSRLWQQQRCPYHNSPPDSMSFSLYRYHHCDSSCFPNTTTTILEIHTDEVWNIEWSHSGEYLASAGKDKSAIIWRVGVGRYLHPLRSSTDPGTHIARERASSEGIHTTPRFARSPISCGVYIVVSG